MLRTVLADVLDTVANSLNPAGFHRVRIIFRDGKAELNVTLDLR